jgi:hypothetical protein
MRSTGHFDRDLGEIVGVGAGQDLLIMIQTNPIRKKKGNINNKASQTRQDKKERSRNTFESS